MKTIKDLDLDEYPDHRVKYILKQAAREWIDKLEETIEIPSIDPHLEIVTKEKIRWIKHFFNLNDEVEEEK